ncbi:MAG TPA: hypothetical protein VK701_03960 [Solirubrobacteraceae bacterium]|nr:hypothetical protein [Solirubrobacteraceae bacterium]
MVDGSPLCYPKILTHCIQLGPISGAPVDKDPPVESPAAPTPATPTHIEVTAEDTEAFRFVLSRPTVPAGKVIIEFINHGQDDTT